MATRTASTTPRSASTRSQRAATKHDDRATARVVDGVIVRGAARKNEKPAARAARVVKSKTKAKSAAQPKTAKRRARYTADTADRYELYQLAVQSPEVDIEVLTRVFRRENGRAPLALREDFCGTALLCSAWVESRRDRSAEGFDIDPEPIAWGLDHHLGALSPEAAARVRIHMRDVRARGHARPDVRVALNFSYCVFQERATLLEYFREARASLVRGGLLVLDSHGGPEATEDLEEKRRIDGGFTYVWEQPEFDPFTAHAVRHISFKFRDGTKLRKAFSYEWRLWTLPEVRDLLIEAGFRRVDVYAEGWDKEGKSGNSDFRLARKGENCASWIVYVVAVA